MIKNYKTLNMLDKSILWNILYSTIALIIGLVLLLIDSSWIAGILVGLILVWTTSIINHLIYGIPTKGAMNAVGLPIIVMVLRVLIFIAVFCTLLFYVNPLLTGYEIFDKRLIFQDVNTLVILFVYLIPMYSYFTVGIIDLFSKG